MNINKKIRYISKRFIVISLIAALLIPVFLLSKETSAVKGAEISDEFRGVWIAYYDFDETFSMNKKEFSDRIEKMFDNVVSWGLNTVVVHVRPFGDAMYKSSYFPWSYYASGKQGKNPGYDPLSIMIEKAHERNLKIHAWINPYRVSSSWNGGTDISKLSKKNKARIWLSNKKKKDDRYVLPYDGALYFNPAVKEIRTLIVNGVKEIVENYDVDGIHFDDYFYPEFGSEYETAFDAQEYEAYKKNQKKNGKKILSIVDWRKNNVNTLIKSVYKAVKKNNPNTIFGISPGGFIDYLDDVDSGYVDYRTWMSKDGYIDYICPQLYWSFNSKNIFPFYDTLLKWIDAAKNDNVKLYVGLPAYKMNSSNSISSLNSSIDSEWYNQFLLADMLLYLRRSERATGFIVFDYEDMTASKNSEMVKHFKEEISRYDPIHSGSGSENTQNDTNDKPTEIEVKG